MKKTCIAVLSTILILLTACSGKAPADSSQDMSAIYGDWVAYDTISDIGEAVDCVIVARVQSQGDVVSVRYNLDDFANFSALVESDSYTASLMKLSIRTPYTIEVQETLSTDVNITAGDTLTLHQIGGTIGSVTLTDNSVTPLKVGSTYVFFLNQRTTDEGTYYDMITPVQGYAEIVDTPSIASLTEDTALTFTVSEGNHLFDNIASLDEIRVALGK